METDFAATARHKNRLRYQPNSCIHTFLTVHTYIHTYIDIQTYSGNNGAGVQVVFHAMPARQDKTHTSKGRQHLFPFKWHGMACHGRRPRHRSATHDFRLLFLSTHTYHLFADTSPALHTYHVCIGGHGISPVFGNGHESLMDVLQPESDSDNRPWG